MDSKIIKETELETGNLPTNEILHNGDEDARRLMFYTQRMKLAVAIAVIQSTPQGSTPEKHAASFIRSFTDGIEIWKAKCETLEKEMFTLQQNLQTLNLKEKLHFPDSDISMLDETGFDTKTHQHVHPPLNLKLKISNTIEFVRSFILLGSVSSHNNDANEKEGSNETLRETVLRSISLLFEYLRGEDGLLLEFGIAKRAIDEVHRLFDSRVNFFQQELVEICMNFVEQLLRDIYGTLEINMINYQHRRSAFIQMLAEHKSLTPLILSRLLREITIFSESLASQFRPEVEDYTFLLHVENVYYVLQATEGTLHIMRQQGSVLNAIKIPKNLLSEWDKTTEKSLLEIGTHLPMYSIYVWHVKALMKSVLKSDLVN